MSEKIEKACTYFVFGTILIGSVFGLVYPLTNPTAYAELLKYPHYIPMVQHHIDPSACPQLPTMVIDHGSNPLCEIDKKFV